MPAKGPTINLENAILAYIAGESAEDASRRFHISETRLVTALRERGMFRTLKESRTLSKEKSTATLLAQSGLPINEIAQRYIKGESVLALSKAYGVARGTIEIRLREAGIKQRSASEANLVMSAKMTIEQRQARSKAAHDAVRGRTPSFEELCHKAISRQKKQSHVSPAERQFAQWLEDMNVPTIPQLAIGPYNADIAIHPVAVEIFGGSWHAYGSHATKAGKRLRYFLDQGWNLVFVWVDTAKWPLTIDAAKYVASFYQITSADPSIRSQYRVIRGGGQEMPVGGFYFNKAAGIPTLGRSSNAGS